MAKKFAVIFMMIMLSTTFTGCVELAVVVVQGVVDIAEAVVDVADDLMYRAAAQKVSQYDDEDTF